MLSSIDTDHIRAHSLDAWRTLSGARIFVTGGTGFFGTWLLESFVAASQAGELDAELVVLSRDPEAFGRKFPHLARHPRLSFTQGDILDFAFPAGPFDHVIHGATAASAALNREAPLQMFDTILAGTRRVLDFARARGVRKFLNISSGAVYGRQPPSLPLIEEDFAGAPDPLLIGNAYSEGKRAAEYLSTSFAQIHGIQLSVARCFAFVGPHLPLDAHFAAGNFIRDGLAGRNIVIRGDGTVVRSYLYAGDLTVWLWKLLASGRGGRAYNVGSDQPYSIAALAALVRDVFRDHFNTRIEIEIHGTPVPGQLPERYIPAVNRAKSELGLEEWIDLSEGIRRTIEWHRRGR
jgi:nucleoside-diphosphate-sugar epimerase